MSGAGIPVGADVYATQFRPELDGAGMCTRIDVHKHAGYFDLNKADGIKAMTWRSEVSHPPTILRVRPTRRAGPGP